MKDRLASIAKVLGIAAMLALSGCYSSGRVRDLPTIASAEPTSRLVVIRESSFFGGAISFVVKLDGTEVFTLRSGEYTEFPIPSGDHVLEVGQPRQVAGWLGILEASVLATSKDFPMDFWATELTALPGQTYHFVVGPPSLSGEPRPKVLDAAAATALLAKSTFVSPAATSGRQ